MERFQRLEDMQRHLWNMLFQASVKRNHPMRTPVMATQDAIGPAVRTLILRQVNTQECTLLFFTDIRSGKVDEISKNGRIATLFWDAQKKVQIRCQGQAFVEQGTAQCRRFWDQLNTAGRSSYASIPSPGSPAGSDASGLPDNWSSQWGPAETDYAFRNFALIRQEVDRMEGLHLHQQGHQRASFSRKNDEDGWAKTWLIP